MLTAIGREILLMSDETAQVEAEIKAGFTEDRNLFKNISMEDYNQILELEVNKDEFKDFEFVPKKNDQFVKVLDLQPFM